MTRDELASTKGYKYNIALFGGATWVALYIYFATEQRTVVNPLVYKRSDNLRSFIILYLNLVYSGLTEVRLPYSVTTSGHHVSVDRPRRSASILVYILVINSVMNRGCSFTLSKKRTQLF